MHDFKPITWAVLLAMLALIILPVIYMDFEVPANNQQNEDPFGFDHSWRPPANNSPTNKPAENTPANDAKPAKKSETD